MSVGKPLTVTEQSLRLKNALQVKPIVATVMVEEMDIRCDCDFVTRSKLFTTITTTPLHSLSIRRGYASTTEAWEDTHESVFDSSDNLLVYPQ